MKLQLDLKKVTIAMARNALTVTELAKRYGVSRARMNVILNSQKLTPESVGRLAKALETDVTDLLAED